MRRFPLLLTLATAGCAGTASNAPSLAPRAAEAIDPRVPVPEPTLAMAPDPALATQLSALVAQAEAADARFRAAAPAVQQAASAAAARHSESWVVAQQALSVLIAARGPVTQALGDIHELATGRIQRLGGIAAADKRAIEAAAARVAELDRAEAALVDRLQARLG